MEIARLKHPLLLRPAMLYVAWVALFFVIFFRSWVSEDAYITFRVIDNFLNGYGLRWNVTERVQVYTHPLWLLLQLPFASWWDNLFQMNMALSLMCSTIAVGIVLLTFRKSLGVTLVFFMLPLFLSKTFIDYSGSGLETSLSFLLFAMFGYALIHWQDRGFFPFVAALLSSLLLLNRFDHVILLAPLLLTLGYQHYARLCTFRGITLITLGALPLISWFAFSLFYYGFIFPNTKYAKLDTGLPLLEYLGQGMQYAFIWLTHDTASVLVLIASLVLALRQTSPAIFQALAIGLLLNYAYVFYIGGDYMMGRFYAVIFFVAIWLLLAISPSRVRPDILFAATLALFVAFTISYVVREIRDTCPDCIPVRGRVLDARKIFHRNALFTEYWPPKMRTEGTYKFAQQGKDLALENPPPVIPKRYLGMLGYYAGPGVVLIDELALADPLLSRLPAQKEQRFYVGHYRRDLPKGYVSAVRSGTLEKMDPDLAQYYDRLRFITQGPLWDKQRLITILRFNFGQYDHYKRSYLKKPR